MRFGANSVLFVDYDLETAIKHIAWAGYDGIELSAIKDMCEHLNLDTWKQDASKIKDLAATYNLELLGIELASLDEARLATCFEAAKELGIPVINTNSGGTSGNEEDMVKQVDWLAKMAARATEYGRVLCIKAHIGCVVDNTPSTLRAMAEIPSPGFGIDMDPSHIFRANENPVDALRQVISRVRHVHIRDCVKGGDGGPGPAEMQACGRGDIDLLGYINVLHQAGYPGPVDLEVIGSSGYELSRCAVIAAESRGYLNACLKACKAGKVNR